MLRSIAEICVDDESMQNCAETTHHSWLVKLPVGLGRFPRPGCGTWNSEGPTPEPLSRPAEEVALLPSPSRRPGAERGGGARRGRDELLRQPRLGPTSSPTFPLMYVGFRTTSQGLPFIHSRLLWAGAQILRLLRVQLQ